VIPASNKTVNKVVTRLFIAAHRLKKEKHTAHGTQHIRRATAILTRVMCHVPCVRSAVQTLQLRLPRIALLEVPERLTHLLALMSLDLP
jgi:hypothetical protein